jgi:hydrogenase maturation protease
MDCDIKAPVLIIGIGNRLLRDEGVGIHVIDELSRCGLPGSVELLDGGTGGIGLLYWMQGRSKIVFVDAIEAHEKPGTIFRFALDRNGRNGMPTGFSMHQEDVAGILATARIIDMKLPEMVMIAVQAGEIEWGMNLSASVQDSMTKIVALVREEIQGAVYA